MSFNYARVKRTKRIFFQEFAKRPNSILGLGDGRGEGGGGGEREGEKNQGVKIRPG